MDQELGMLTNLYNIHIENHIHKNKSLDKRFSKTGLNRVSFARKDIH